MKKLIIALIVIAAVGLAVYGIKSYEDNAIYRNPAFASGNGRLEATEVNIAAKLAGKIEDITVDEGDYVKKGQKLVQMQTNVLKATLAQAQAMIKVKESELASAKAVRMQKVSLYKNAENRYKRAKTLVEKNAASQQTFAAAKIVDDMNLIGVRLANGSWSLMNADARIITQRQYKKLDWTTNDLLDSSKGNFVYGERDGVNYIISPADGSEIGTFKLTFNPDGSAIHDVNYYPGKGPEGR